MEQERKSQDYMPPAVKFGGGGTASVAGSVSGVAMAIGVPWVILSQGQALGSGMQTTLVMIAVISGAFICFISAFFGLVMPNSVNEQAHGGDRKSPEAK